MRPHFRAELAGKLARAGHAQDEIAAALVRLGDLGYLDERALIAQELDRLATRRLYGPLRVRAELLRRGADPELVAEAVAGRRAADEAAADASTEGGSGDLAAGRRAAAAWRRRGGTDPAALARHLARKGFPAATVYTVLAEQGFAATADLAAADEE